MATGIGFNGPNDGQQIAINNGQITFNCHRKTECGIILTDGRSETLETTPSVLSTVPFGPDSDFIDRGPLLDQVHERFSSPPGRMALVGVGGVGKSKLAIEYSYKLREKSPEIWVFWIHASNATRFEQSFREIADRAKVPGRHDPKANIFKIVHNWLHAGGDDDGFLHEHSPMSQPLSTFIPRSPNGTIILTTRSQSVALRFVDKKDLIMVEPMDEPQALALLQKKLGGTDREDALKLVEALEFMPLAIIQAAAYIDSRSPRCSISQYLHDFQKSDRQRLRLLGHEAGNLYRDWDANNAILITWQLSFDHIRQIRESATDLLSLMSFFDRQGIADSLLRVQPNTTPGAQIHDFSEDSEDNEDSDTEYDLKANFEDDIRMLRDYSFISVNEEVTVLKMHGLVQLAMRNWLDIHGEIERWKRQFIENLSSKFPVAYYDNLATCQLLFPHVKSAVSQRPVSDDALQDWAALLYQGARYAWVKGNVIEMKSLIKVVIKTEEKILGPEHEDTLHGFEILGMANQMAGQFREAEEVLLRLLETRKKVLGAEHRDTLNTMTNLANVYFDQGRWQEAEALQVEVLKTLKRQLGVEDLGIVHSDMLLDSGNLARTYSRQGRLKDAEALEMQVLEARKRVLGAEHPHTLGSIEHLALIYTDQRRLQDAERLQIHVLETRKRVLGTGHLGAEHHDTLLSMHNLGSIYFKQNRLRDAKGLLINVLDTRQKTLGVEHPSTLVTMSFLAAIYEKEGFWQDSETLQMQVLEIRKRVLGTEHPDTLLSMSILALAYRDNDRVHDAEVLSLQVLDTRRRVLGADHRDTLRSMGDLAMIFTRQGKSKDAEALQVKVLDIQKRVLGAGNPETLLSMSNLKALYTSLERWQDCETIDSQILSFQKRDLGDGHPETLRSMYQLAKVRKRLGKHAEAIDLMTDYINFQTRTLGASHPDIVASTDTLMRWKTECLRIGA
ncbi:kinesin [Penicillium frequentans]|uniref:Kinesin n=1 Tax=Penicillium frequentans TaxID=3151616 RepID=A0AAD6CS49_9EURO|nr:kinesin [Penicillium glabrum]